MTLVKVLDVTFTGMGASAPTIAKIDRIETNGSLLLIDPTHPYGPLKSTNFVNNDVMTNLMASKFSELTGNSVGVDATMSQTISSPARLQVERTGKGGIHAIVQQLADTAVTDKYVIKLPAQLLSYLNANPTHKYYVSLWNKTTRASSYAGTSFCPTFLTIANNTSIIDIAFNTSTSGYCTNSGGLSGSNTVSANSEDAHLFAAAINNGVAGLSDGSCSLWCAGAFGAWNASGAGSGSSDDLNSHIFYRVYVEDLTVSERTYAEVFAIDNALYTKEVLTAGGRYYSDTFTDPDTVTFS